MRLAIFGATGGTGRRLVEQALARGHDVNVLVRRPETLPIRDPRLRIVRGDVLNPATVRSPVTDVDAVISTLGVGYRRGPTTVYSRGIVNIIDAMHEAGVKRLVCVSTTSIESAPGTPFGLRLLHRLVLQRILERPYSDIRVMERTITGSDRPGRPADQRAAARHLPRGSGTPRGPRAVHLPRRSRRVHARLRRRRESTQLPDGYCLLIGKLQGAG
jgi:hypothetical protein